jgi:hypothetical protein
MVVKKKKKINKYTTAGMRIFVFYFKGRETAVRRKPEAFFW